MIETDVLVELAVDHETLDAAQAVVTDNVDRLRKAGVAGAGHLLRVVGGHGSAGRQIAEFAESVNAEMIIIGTPGDSEITEIFDASLTSELVRHARCAVHIVAPTDEHTLLQASATNARREAQ